MKVLRQEHMKLLEVYDDKILQSTKLSKHVFEKLKKEVKEESDNLKAV